MFANYIFLIFVFCCTSFQDGSAAESNKFLCPASEIARFDFITTKVISFTPQQRKHPENKAAVAKFCT